MDHETKPPPLDPATHAAVGHVLGRIPQGLWILTATFEERRAGVMVSWVQQACFEPPMVTVAILKGRPIVPLIHDSHAFALSQVSQDDKLTLQKFAHPDEGVCAPDEDPLASIETARRVTGAPIIRRSISFLDCELARHFDIDGDHDLYVGLVRDGGMLHEGQITVRLRENGYRY